jgi:hypothetical protein
VVRKAPPRDDDGVVIDGRQRNDEDLDEHQRQSLLKKPGGQ